MNDKHLLTESSVGRLYCYWEEFRGEAYLHIRYWYLDKKDQEWKPTRKGVAIPEDGVHNLLAALKVVLSLRPIAPPKAKDGVEVYG